MGRMSLDVNFVLNVLLEMRRNILSISYRLNNYLIPIIEEDWEELMMIQGAEALELGNWTDIA